MRKPFLPSRPPLPKSSSLKLFSPAKINLFLNILSKRPDGYHNLETLFERIDLGDEIILKKKPSGVFLRVSSSDVPKNGTNLAFKAAELVRRECGIKKGVEITLKKRIPVSAGLGGGSSNAATVLLGLNRLWRLRLTKQKLLNMASKLGSDVPFFVLGTPFALGRGRGEILRPVRGIQKKLWHCLVKPSFGIATKDAYKGLPKARLTGQKSDVRMLVRALKTGDLECLSNLLTNSLELSVNKRLRIIYKIKKKLVSEGALASLMSGSGSTVFGVFSSEKNARNAARNLKQKNRHWQVFVASTY